MLLIIICLLLLIAAFKSHFARYILAGIFIFLAIFAQRVEVLENNMAPNVNARDILLTLNPVCKIGDFQIASLRIVPGFSSLFRYAAGDMVVVNDIIKTNETETHRRRLMRLIGFEDDVVEMSASGILVNGKPMRYKKYGEYSIENNGKNSYLILPSSYQPKAIMVPKGQVLCMYDNRSAAGKNGPEVLIERKEFQFLPVFNLTNIKKYFVFLCNFKN